MSYSGRITLPRESHHSPQFWLRVADYFEQVADTCDVIVDRLRGPIGDDEAQRELAAALEFLLNGD